MKPDTSLLSIQKFFGHKEIAIIGLSTHGKKMSNEIEKELLAKGYKIYAVNPKFQTETENRFKTIQNLPTNIQSAIFLTPKNETPQIVNQIIEKGIKNIWIQQGAHNPSILENKELENINLIYNKCVMMFAEPVVSVHKFHKSILKLFGKLPK